MYMYSKKEKKIMQTKVCYLIEYFPYIGLCLHNWLPKQVSGVGLPSRQLKRIDGFLLQHFFFKPAPWIETLILAHLNQIVLCHVHFRVPALHNLMKHVFLDYNVCNYGTLRYRFISLCKVMIMMQQMTVIL